jgi:hypothetical protein
VFIKTTLPAKICASAALRLRDFATLRETKWYYNMKIAEMNIFLFSRKGAKALRIRTLIPSTGDQRYPYFVYIIRLYPVVPTINLIKSREMAMDFV